jgi:hypothetical protein
MTSFIYISKGIYQAYNWIQRSSLNDTRIYTNKNFNHHCPYWCLELRNKSDTNYNTEFP